MPGVAAVHVVQGPGTEIMWAGDDIVVVAAVDERAAADAARLVKVEYEPLPFFVDDFSQPKNVAEGSGPLETRDLIGMFTNQVPEPQIIQAIQQRGVTFKVSDEMIGMLNRCPADAAQRVSENCSHINRVALPSPSGSAPSACGSR